VDRATSEERLASSDIERFEAVVLPHLDAAYTLARHLMRNDHDAEDAVQDAYLRALRYFDGFRGGDGRVWLLMIVRNSCMSAHTRRGAAAVTEFDEAHHSGAIADDHPEAALLRSAARASVRRALDTLPFKFREAIVLRELEGLSYKEIGDAVGVPVGTVMSRLSRARQRLREALGTPDGEGR
jgi:RNA polymerase sigma-70 factor (ECF subfamily)